MAAGCGDGSQRTRAGTSRRRRGWRSACLVRPDGCRGWGTRIDVEILRSSCCESLPLGNIELMIRGDLGAISFVFVACASRTGGLVSDGQPASSTEVAMASSARPDADVESEHADDDPTTGWSMSTRERWSASEVAGGDSERLPADASSGPECIPGDASLAGDAGARASFHVTAHLANQEDPDAPTTVGIVTWSTTFGTPSEATIEYGLTREYGMSAPVDVSNPSLRTVLLGMKPTRTYHFRINADVVGANLRSEDFTITTGAAPASDVVSIASFEVLSAQQHEPGFLVGSYWNGTYEGMVFILDQDGDIVWWYRSGLKGGVAKAAFSDDGRDIWMISAANNGGEHLVRVGVDGLRPQVYANTGGSHDIMAIEGDVMAFIDYSGPNSAIEIDRSGHTRTIFESKDFPPRGATPHHLNALAYDSATQTYVVSSLDTDVYLFPRDGATSRNTRRLTDIAGANSGWGGNQHGVQLLPENHLLLFANKDGGTLGPSAVIELDLNDGQELWRYEADEFTANFGDVQRLPGGNTLITYSNAGVIHEVTPERAKVLEITASKYLGYVTWRPTLYALPSDVNE